MENTLFKILLIDNDEEVTASVGATLQSEGYSVITSNNSKEALQVAKKELPHLIIIELLMPEIDGIEMCIELRQTKELSESIIIFYTSRNEDYSQVAAFNVGADDYIIKPAKPRVLLSRVKALLKRHAVNTDLKTNTHQQGLVIDREKYLVYCDGIELILPRKEFELLDLLASSPRKVFTRKDISLQIWGYEIVAKNRTIDVHIRKLREKLGDQYIKTIKGIGYSLEV